MRITLVTDVTRYPDLNKRLHYALQSVPNLPFAISLWMRDKQLTPPEVTVWADRWRWLCDRHGLRFEISLHHAHLINSGDVLHVPDVPKLRHQAHQHYRKHHRILSLHGLDQLGIALANPEIEVMLSPLYRPFSKEWAGTLLDRKGLEALKRQERERIHLMGGLTVDRITPILSGNFASYALMTAWQSKPDVFFKDMASRVEQS
tara:strand:- start:91 stop:702 length:612 start_codon:yes stop_codon:yes gene_type:complete